MSYLNVRVARDGMTANPHVLVFRYGPLDEVRADRLEQLGASLALEDMKKLDLPTAYRIEHVEIQR